MTYWTRNNITLICRDSLSSKYISCEVMVTDPPYGIKFKSGHRNKSHKEIANDDSLSCLLWCCNFPAIHSKYIFCRWQNLVDVPQPKSYITWVKNNTGMGDLNHTHAPKTEGILFYPGSDHYWPEREISHRTKKPRRRPSDVVSHPKQEGNPLHPTQKPVSLMKEIISWTSGEVFDPFMGSGSTAVACALMGRSFVGIELDKDYFDIAVKRVENVLNVGKDL